MARCVRSQSVSNLMYYSGNCLDRLKKKKKTFFKVVAVADYIGTRQIHTTCQKLQYCSHVLGNGVQVPERVLPPNEGPTGQSAVWNSLSFCLLGIEPPLYTSWFVPSYF